MTDFRDDPSPVDDLPSDVEFGGWLESLDPAVVLKDLESGLRGREKATLTYVRRKVLQSLQSSDQSLVTPQGDDTKSPFVDRRR